VRDGLFAYGTLQFPEVTRAILGRALAGVPAVLAGYRRARARSADFPGLIACPGGSVDGVVYRGVSDADLETLDAFEGELFDRRRVSVAPEGEESVFVFAYVVAPAFVTHFEGDWDPRAFAANGLARFIARVRSGRYP
jgi:gamma-glutamylcyclotransferase (GGCT)/AIG2-like uncharacterized protein YtfP